MDIQKAKRAIDACDIISFDIFDTLMVRLCARAEDVFRLVERKTKIRGFAAAREETQRRCSLRIEREGKGPHCTFSDIYEYMKGHFKAGLNGYTFEQLKQTELDTEKAVLVKNVPVYELFCYAKNAGKRVIAVSDMYLGKKEIMPLLENCGYTGFDAVYISADVKKTKYRLDMYEYVVKRENVSAGSILHIGDSQRDDFENAKSCGLKALLYDGARDKRKMPLFNSICAGAANMLKNRDSGFWYGLGASVGGPLYCALIPMLLGKIKRCRPEKLFFISRDGYNMHQIFKRLKLTDIPTEYFYASRRSLLLCGIDTIGTAEKTLLPPFTFGQSIMDILSYLDMADVDEKCVKQAGFSGFDDIIRDISDFGKFRNIFDFCPEYFRKKAKEEREGFKKYISDTGYGENCLVFDAGWNGSSQFLLDRALILAGIDESRFVYAGLSDKRKCRRQLRGKKYTALLFGAGKNADIFRRLRQSIVILELFFGAPHPAVWKYGKDGVVYENGGESLEFKEELLRGIADCVETAMPVLRGFGIGGGVKEALAPVFRLIEHPTRAEAVEIGNIENADGFAARQGVKKYIARLDKSDITPELNEFYWPQGIYARPDIDESVKKFVLKKTGVKMPKQQKKTEEKRPNVFMRVRGYIGAYGFATTARLIYKRLTAKSGIKAYHAYIRSAEKNITQTEELAYKPLFSFVVPVYNVEEKILRECIDSILAQTYDNYELILVDDRSTMADVPRVLAQYEDMPRVKVIYRSENGHISRCTNTGIEAAKGEYIVFADCDDTIAPNAVYELTRAVNINRDTDFIYSDEDKLSEKGERFFPHFKPDWSPDTLMSHMYTSHLSAYRTSITREIGGLRPGFEGAQDYDFTLRFTEKTNRVYHIPKILYHWRVREGSTAAALSEKPYVMEAMLRLKTEALERRGLKGKAVLVPQVHQYRVVYDVPQNALVSIIILSKDNFEVLERCLESITEKTEYKNYELIVVDNGSSNENREKYAELCKKKSAQYIYEKEDFNFSKMCNRGARAAKGEYLLFLNDDTEVTEGGWLGAMAGQAALGHVGAVGARLRYPDGSIQHCGIINNSLGPCHAFSRMDDNIPQYFCRNMLEYDCIAVTAACLCIDRKKFDAVGGFDESFAVAYNDVELCFKLLEAGYYNVVRNDAILYHHESLSRGYDAEDAKKQQRLIKEMDRLYQKHPRFKNADPFYNPNLSGDRVDFALADGGRL